MTIENVQTLLDPFLRRKLYIFGHQNVAFRWQSTSSTYTKTRVCSTSSVIISLETSIPQCPEKIKLQRCSSRFIFFTDLSKSRYGRNMWCQQCYIRTHSQYVCSNSNKYTIKGSELQAQQSSSCCDEWIIFKIDRNLPPSIVNSIPLFVSIIHRP